MTLKDYALINHIISGIDLVAYIAGPMRGIDQFNRPAFFFAGNRVYTAGFSVLNPALLPTTMPESRYMPICLAMLGQADIAFFLPGWEDSEGAKLEMAYAKAQGIPTFLLEKDTEEAVPI